MQESASSRSTLARICERRRTWSTFRRQAFAAPACPSATGNLLPPPSPPPAYHASRCCFTRFESLAAFAGLDEQRALLHRSAPQVRPRDKIIYHANARHGPLGRGRSPRRRKSSSTISPSFTPPVPPPPFSFLPFLPFSLSLPRAHRAVPRSQARWRRGEAVSMMSAREQMMSYEQIQHLVPQPRVA